VSAAQIIALITVPLCGVIVQLQRLIPVFRKQVVAQNETNAGVRLLLEHAGLWRPPASSPELASKR